MALFHIVLPIAFVLGSIGIIKDPEAFPDPCFPVSFISISQVLAFPSGF
jgi:hypothetical protein